MSDLIVIGFSDEFKADEVLLDLRRLEMDYLIDLEDAAIVVRNQNGKVRGCLKSRDLGKKVLRV